MTGADVVIGWVSDIDGTAVFHVRMESTYIRNHRKYLSFTEPVKDASNI